MEPKYFDLKNRLAEIHDLNKVSWVLGWDQRTMMPPKGAAVRAEQLATLDKAAHEKFTSDEVGYTSAPTVSRSGGTNPI